MAGSKRRTRSKAPKKFTSRSKVTSFTRRGSDVFGSEARSVSQKWLMAAGEVIAVQARANASKFSTRIGPATTVAAGDTDDEAIVITDGNKAPNGLPFEYGERHPLNWPNQVNGSKPFGKMPKRPYLAKAVRTQSQAALEVYAKSIDEIAVTAGYNE